jgi:hypothetical protein
MRALLISVFLLISLPALADDYLQLFQSAGWPQQRANFSEALAAAQQQYRDNLPPPLFQVLLDNSNRRFAPQAMEQRALQTLRQQLADPRPALAFFRSEVGGKSVAAMVYASRRDQLALFARGLPRMQASAGRRQLIEQLGQTIPASEAGAEVSLALAGVAADSLSQMLPGVFSGAQAQSMLDGQRQRLITQIDKDLDNSLLYVYRDMNDAELQQYLDFARSPAGQDYYQAALAALRAALATPQ